MSGTYAQFHGDFGTQPISASPLGKGVLLMGVVLALGIAWTVRWLNRMGSEPWPLGEAEQLSTKASALALAAGWVRWSSGRPS